MQNNFSGKQRLTLIDASLFFLHMYNLSFSPLPKGKKETQKQMVNVLPMTGIIIKSISFLFLLTEAACLGTEVQRNIKRLEHL